ncbi:hypothetical protein GGR55DRAFT_636984 [Xylaria sp. FL0064]|nr:hypothetical protein GGR55DRAFT_636984 [Xylaria sp. FL0064]
MLMSVVVLVVSGLSPTFKRKRRIICREGRAAWLCIICALLRIFGSLDKKNPRSRSAMTHVVLETSVAVRADDRNKSHDFCHGYLFVEIYVHTLHYMALVLIIYYVPKRIGGPPIRRWGIN